MTVRILESLGEISAARWNALVHQGDPFVRHEFLSLLESSGCAEARTGWQPQHLLLENPDGTLRGALPLYLKPHSWGEFVFDWSWANAYARAGQDYYPKLVSAIPFTPATGPRLLVAPGADAGAVRAELAAAALAHARALGVSSLHVLFTCDADQSLLQASGFTMRRDCQFHWENRGYADFEAFLATFRADKRKKAHRERRRIGEAGIEFRTLHGKDMDARLWRTVHGFSADTFRRHGHEHYLTAGFFGELGRILPQMIMVKLALLQGEPVAAALFFVGGDTLYGRYWGAAQAYDSLHFEACYYQGIEYCIEHGLARFEPGTQGEHKVPRGFEPRPTQSAHWIADPHFATAIGRYLREEGIAVDQYIAGVNDHLPYRREP